MSGRVQAQVKVPSGPAPSFAPVQSGLLQRKSLLGGAPGLAGEFADYRGKRLVSQPPLIQTKLTINQPNDRYEQEADRVADAVMRMPELGVQRQSIEDEEEEQIQTKPVSEQITPLVQRQVEEELQTKMTSGNIPEVQHNIESHIHSLKGGGQPLSENDRAFFEPRFGDDFSQVRVHTDTRAAETAKSLKTRAFTVGRDIAFGAGQYAPESHEGRQLLAHELTHVVQQNDGVSAYIQRNNPRSVSNMTIREKWSIVYEAAICGAGDGMALALAILLGFIMIIALAAIILGIICPPCIATISAFLATTIWGASVAMWLTALLVSIGVAVSIETMRSEYIIVNRAVGQAQTEDDLRRAGQRWGHNTGRELFNFIASIFAASSRIRTFVGNLARRLSGLRSGTPATSPAPEVHPGRPRSGQLVEERVPTHTSARLGEPTTAELREIRRRYPGAERISEQRAVWLTEMQASTRRVVVGERNCADFLGVPRGGATQPNMVDLVRIQRSGLRVPIEVKNQIVVDLVGRTNAAFNKFRAIARHSNMRLISHFEVHININSRLPSNFRVTQEGILEKLISGTNRWERVIIGGKQVLIRRGPLGQISSD